MATISEMFVEIGADASQFDQATRAMQQDMRELQRDMQTLGTNITGSSSRMSDSYRRMSSEMRAAFDEQRRAMQPFREAQHEIEYGYFQMAQGMGNYSGSTQQFMDDLTEMGNRHRQINDQMIANNNMLRMGFIQGISAMLARSTASSKIAANFDRMRNPLYRVNNGLLTVTGNMERMAARGQPAALALRMLGPTANMKKLMDMTRLISAGLMRMNSVALVAAAGTAMLFTGLAKAAMDSVPGYKEAVGQMGSAVREAFQPMVEVFAAVTKPIIELITHVANLANKFNEAHPMLAKIIQGFLMLIPLLMLILSPLAIGIGLWAGLQAAMASAWVLIGPLITGLGAMMGTVLIVAAAIAVLVAAVVLLWQKNDAFRAAVIAAWEFIKTSALAIWEAIKKAVTVAIEALVKFGSQQMDKFKKFWDTNGADIKAIASAVWGFIQNYIKGVMDVITSVMKVAWPIIKTLVQTTWEAMKVIIGGAIDIILGIIQTFIKLFKGDWSGAWESVKGVASSFIGIITGLINIDFVQTIISAITTFVTNMVNKATGLWTSIKSAFTTGVSDAKESVTSGLNGIVSFITGLGTTFYNAGKGLIDMMAQGIENAASKVVSTVKKLASDVRDFLPFSPAKTGPLSDLDKLDFGGPISDSLTKGIPQVKRLMNNMLTMPEINGPGVAATGGDTYQVNVALHADDINQMQSIYDFFDTFKQTKRARG